MSDAADDLAAFSAKTSAQRQEDFEASTLALVLRQLGWETPQVRGFQLDLGPAFGWDWFNDELSILDFRVGSLRIPEFNFEKLWERPTTHQVSVAWRQFVKEHLPDPEVDHGALVFRCFGLGRLVATNLPGITSDRTFISVSYTPGQRYSVLPFTAFFDPWKEPRDG